MDLTANTQAPLGQRITKRARLSPLFLGSLAFLACLFLGISPTSAATPPSPACAPATTGDLPLAGGAGLDVFDSLAQLLPSQPQVGGSIASICQAANGIESFQVQVTAAASPITVGSVSASALSGPAGASIPATDVSLFREEYTTLSTLSDEELSAVLPRDKTTGQCTAGDCRFPDALIPNIDPLFHEKRNAFPFTVPANQDRVVWADAYVPAGQTPGLYTGTLTFTTSTGASATIAISLQVIDATLPSTSSLHSAFFITLGGERGLTGGRVTPEQYEQYAELGLDNRINIVPNSAISEESKAIEDAFKPLLTGTAPHVLLQGAQLTDLPVGVQFGASNLALYKSLFEKLGVANRVSIYCDEVTPQQCASSVTTSGFEHTWPGLPVLPTATSGWSQSGSSIEADEKLFTAQGAPLRGLIPIAQILDPTTNAGNRLGLFTAWRAKQAGRQVWDYTSCESAGCGSAYIPEEDLGNPNYLASLSGWPSYGIDQVATQQRAMGWQMFANGLEGEEYWGVNTDTSIWTAPYTEGVNGDGTLFYPWDATRVGGAKAIPIESIRLKRIRDGRQDYELLKLASQLSSADATTATNLAKAEFPSMHQSGPSAGSFDSTRAQLLDLFPASVGLIPAAPTTVVATTGNASATVRWHAPASNGAAITGYTVSASPGGASCTTTGALSCTVKGLTNNAAYTFTVTARSSSGSSAASVSSGLVVAVASDSIADLNCDGTADFVAVAAGSGRLLFYPRLKSGSVTDWAANAPITIGSGFGGSQATLAYRSIFFAGDVNGDGAPDLIGVRANGQMMLLPGNCTGQVGAPISIGASTSSTPIGVGDFNTDGHPDLIERRSDGTLWMLPGTGKGTFAQAQHIGSGWGGFDTIIAAGDVNGDGHPDLIARESNGTLLLYEGNGKGGWTAATEKGGIVLGPKLPASEYPILIGDGDFDQNGTVDLTAIDAGGHLLNFSGAEGNFTATGKVIGNGWYPSDLVEIAR